MQFLPVQLTEGSIAEQLLTAQAALIYARQRTVFLFTRARKNTCLECEPYVEFCVLSFLAALPRRCPSEAEEWWRERRSRHGCLVRMRDRGSRG